jgi:hypothetical protein
VDVSDDEDGDKYNCGLAHFVDRGSCETGRLSNLRGGNAGEGGLEAGGTSHLFVDLFGDVCILVLGGRAHLERPAGGGEMENEC